ncbi:hypothetical protein HU200_012768 [Digitaria exilis]|uniref:RING-type E3 ubiquitin transferase n=1 Tax=Digitaria exilis TaxID=1010633 RepID=A0A835FEC2_9POAL|nr:hypothetical protein HU200_012768 [Digitaria exilis]
MLTTYPRHQLQLQASSINDVDDNVVDADGYSGFYGYGIAAVCATIFVFCVLVSTVGVWKAFVFSTLAALLLGVAGCFAHKKGWFRRPSRRAASTTELVVVTVTAGAPVNAPPAFEFQFPREASCVVVCSVCLEDVRGGEMVRQVPACRHVFHVGCIDMWLHSHRTCPMCRCVVSTPEEATMSPKDDAAVAAHEAPESSDDDHELPPEQVNIDVDAPQPVLNVDLNIPLQEDMGDVEDLIQDDNNVVMPPPEPEDVINATSESSESNGLPPVIVPDLNEPVHLEVFIPMVDGQPLQMIPDDVPEDDLLGDAHAPVVDPNEELPDLGHDNNLMQLGFVQMVEPEMDPVFSTLAATSSNSIYSDKSVTQSSSLPPDLFRLWSKFCARPGSREYQCSSRMGCFHHSIPT